MVKAKSPKTARKRAIRRRAPVQERSRQLVDDVLQAAAQVVAEVGFERASTNKIARRAGVSVGSIYQYFPDKDALMGALIDNRTQRLEKMITRRMMSMMGSPFPETAEAILRTFVEFVEAEPRLMRIMLEQLPHMREGQQFNLIEQRVQQVAKTYLMQYAEELQVEDVDAVSFVSMAAMAILGIRIALDLPRNVSRERAIRSTITMLSRYVGATGP